MRTRLLELVARLREAELAISPAETMDALRAVAIAGVEPVVLRESLAATLVKHEEDRAVFDATFDACFPLPPRSGTGPGRQRRRYQRADGGINEGSARGGASGSGSDSGPAGAAAAGSAVSSARDGDREQGHAPAHITPQAMHGDTLGRPPGGHAADRALRATRKPEIAPDSARRSILYTPEPNRGSEYAGARAARGVALLRRPFLALEPHEVDAAHEVARELGRRLAARSARRERHRHRGRIDIRRTIRASLARGGVPIALERRGRRPGKPDLLLLCDVSGSVAIASELLLAILAGAEGAFRRVRRFAFVDRPVEIGFEGRHLMPAEPLDLHAFSDFGAVLRELESRGAARLDAATVVLVLGDARNNRRPARADLLKRLAARSRALVWAVPEPRERWYSGDSALATYEPACSAVCEAISLGGLLTALRESLRH